MIASTSFSGADILRVFKPYDSLEMNAVRKARCRTKPTDCGQPWYILLKCAQYHALSGVDPISSNIQTCVR